VTMRVLHVCGCYLPAVEWGGVVNSVAGMARAAGLAGVECEVFSTTQRSSKALPRIVPGTRTLDGIPVTWFQSLSLGGRGFVAPGMIAALRRRAREFDVVHLHMLWTFAGMVAARAARAQRIPYVFSLHGALDPFGLRQRALEKRLFLLAGERHSLERAALIHYTTEAERAGAPGWARLRPSVVIPNVVDLALEPDLATRREDNELLILGRIHPVKGFDLLLPALARVLREVPAARLTIAGPDEGGYRGRVEALIREHALSGAVRFTGLLEAGERNAALSRAAILVAPSYQENFGMAVGEAMCVGLPVVVSDKVNLAGDIGAAEAGLVVPLESGRLADAIVALLRDPARRQRMGAAGRRLVRERYSAAAVGAQLRRAYEEIAAPYPTRRSPSRTTAQ
jgi:glycosyltransferase involved in cell wall biosynthesis